MYNLEITRRALKGLKKLPQIKKQQFLEVIESMRETPFIGRKLKGELQGNFKYEIKPYRMVYTVDKKTKTVRIKAIDHRQGIYKHLYFLFS